VSVYSFFGQSSKLNMSSNDDEDDEEEYITYGKLLDPIQEGWLYWKLKYLLFLLFKYLLLLTNFLYI